MNDRQADRPVIGIDYTPAHEQGGGIGRYVRELTRAWLARPAEAEARLFVMGARAADLPAPPAPHAQWRSAPFSPRTFARVWHRARLPLPVEAFTGRVQVFHATDFVLPPTLPGTRTVLSVHDLSFVRVPDSASPSLKRYLDAVVPRSVARADHILADSTATKHDLIALYRTPPEKITVLLSGVEARFTPADGPAQAAVRARYRIGAVPYLFTVGTVQPRKNYARLIAALARLRAGGRDLALVIAGGRGWLEDPIYAAVEAHGLSDSVHFIGFADDADLPALYTGAAATVFPSLYEGFGLPVLEAMACGSPVVTSNCSSLPEVAGDAALLVDPLDEAAIADATARVLDDAALRERLIARGRERAAAFTWARAAEQLAGVYARLLA
jgi:glycosyltransferase involved in cell wall biosynthesis